MFIKTRISTTEELPKEVLGAEYLWFYPRTNELLISLCSEDDKGKIGYIVAKSSDLSFFVTSQCVYIGEL